MDKGRIFGKNSYDNNNRSIEKISDIKSTVQYLIYLIVRIKIYNSVIDDFESPTNRGTDEYSLPEMFQ